MLRFDLGQLVNLYWILCEIIYEYNNQNKPEKLLQGTDVQKTMQENMKNWRVMMNIDKFKPIIRSEINLKFCEK